MISEKNTCHHLVDIALPNKLLSAVLKSTFGIPTVYLITFMVPRKRKLKKISFEDNIRRSFIQMFSSVH